MTSEIKVNQIKKASGSTITIGESGDTISLASGASQSGFGRSGTVNWQTTKKTASFTAVNGEGYFVDTTSSAITVTLPASPSGGEIVAIKDYAQTFGTNNVTVGRNSSNIEGVANDITLNGNGESTTLVYVDATKGWVLVNESTTLYGPEFVSATGGDAIVTCGDFKTHIFTSPGNFVVSTAGNSAGSNEVDYFVIAGGGGGGGDGGGGGGAGGFRLSNCVGSIPAPTMSPLVNACGALPVCAQTYPITVGGGGTAGTYSPTIQGGDGSNSVFSTITSAGGGGGGRGAPGCAGSNGGSGGGGTRAQPGGSGNTPPVSPPQGNDGGTGPTTPNGDGGGGAGAAGTGAPGNPSGGAGGIGSFIADTVMGSCAPSYGESGPVSSTRYFAAGGGGGGDSVPSSGGSGGTGGGGNGGSRPNPSPGTAGTTNTGSGGGGAGVPGNAGAGGSGLVMIRYKFQ